MEASLYTLYWGFKKIPFTLYTYVLAKILQNGARFTQKLTLGFKNHTRNFDKFRKYMPSAKTYITDLSNITFNYLCENSPNYLSNF